MMTKQELVSQLQSLGLKNGDKVLLHSSFVSLGGVEGGPEAAIDAFLTVLGPEGTLLAPIFGALGILTETVKKHPSAVIDDCPVGTLAAIGADAEFLLKDHWKADTAHGADTPFTRLIDLDGYVCLLGCDQDRNTSLHGIEALLKLPYLNPTSETFTTREGEKVSKSWDYYPGPHRDFIGIDRYFRESGLMKISRIGNAQVRLIKSKDLFSLALELGQLDPAFVLCDNPACEDCTIQRAAIFADRLKSESFKLTVSSRLAGRYVPEMVENLKNTGISSIELDYLQGKACALLSAQQLQSAAAELRAAGIDISALSIDFIPDDAEKILDLAKSANIGCLIAPCGAVELSALAEKKQIKVIFRNYRLTARACSSQVAAAKTGFCFNPAEFARCGEHPFLYSYGVGRFIRSIAQLDLVDALWDGSAKPLAKGNGEVKELMSILRCHNFPGYFGLGCGGVYPGCLTEAVEDFRWLLDNM